MILDFYSGFWIPDPSSGFFPSPITDPGVRKAPDPGSGSATLHKIVKYLILEQVTEKHLSLLTKN
jgi:hypothetical protein